MGSSSIRWSLLIWERKNKMKKIIIVLCIALVVFAVGYNAYQSEKRANTGKKNVFALLPLTGPMAQTGKEAQAVMDYYYRKGNYSFNLLYIDSETNPTKAITALQQKAVNDDAPIVIAAMSGVVSAVAPYVQQKNGFLYGITAFNKGIPAFQRLHGDIAGMLEPVISYIKDHYKNIAIVYIEDEYGRLERNYVMKRMKELSVSVYEISIGLHTLDVRNEVLKLKAHQPEAVMILGVPTQGYINVMRELKTQEYAGQILMDAGLVAPQIRKQLTNDIIGSCLYLEADTAKNKAQQQFQADLDSMNLSIFCTTIEAVDVLNLIQYTLANNLPFEQKTYENMKQWEGISGTVTFSDKGDSSYQYLLVQHKDGKFVPVEESEGE